ncbi:hypothetical protein OG21DRAFT_1605085 [Imleria badia]|nr:hypothetical protein OG21DRAFT_1605085 [Imleria badia]
MMRFSFFAALSGLVALAVVNALPDNFKPAVPSVDDSKTTDGCDFIMVGLAATVEWQRRNIRGSYAVNLVPGREGPLRNLEMSYCLYNWALDGTIYSLPIGT